jgi:predicted GIY-YIG superfamily endonuclease
VLLRDRLAAAMAAMTANGREPDHQRLAAEVLGIRNVPPELARRLVAQALVVEDRRDEWLRIGERICAAAPTSPGVYVLRDADGRALYVGKANNIRRRLRTHFAARRWRHLKPGFARASAAEWVEAGSELEALLREAEWIAKEQPAVNVQVGAPNLSSRAVPKSLQRDVIVLLPSIESDSLELIAARRDGAVTIQRTRRNGADLAVHAHRLWRFFSTRFLRTREPVAAPRDDLAPIVFSWLGGRGAASTRLDPHDAPTMRALQGRLASALSDRALFSERIVVLQ